MNRADPIAWAAAAREAALRATRAETVPAALAAPAAEGAPPAWPAHRAVARMPGSLPMGGLVAGTPIHAFVHTPDALRLRPEAPRRPTRHDIDLGGLLAFEIRDLLWPAEADALVEASERFGYREEAPGIQTPPGMRMNKSVHWLADEALLTPIFRRMAQLLPAEVDGARLFPRLSERLNMYRYDDGDCFNRHTDGDWPGFGLNEDRTAMQQWASLRSCLTMLLYLNGPAEGVQGGATRLFGADGRVHDVTPAKGCALFFRHGFGPDSVQHIGMPVAGPVAKYVARINVMYAPG